MKNIYNWLRSLTHQRCGGDCIRHDALSGCDGMMPLMML